MMKGTYEKSTVTIIFIDETLIALCLRSGTRQTYLLSQLLSNIVLEVLASAVRHEKEKASILESKK